MINILEILEIQRICLGIIEAIYSKPVANIKLNGETLKAILLKSENSILLSHNRAEITVLKGI